EKSLLNRAVEIDLSDVEDLTTRTLMLKTLRRPNADTAAAAPIATPNTGTRPTRTAASLAIHPEIQDILSLRSRDRDRILDVLHREDGVSALVVPEVIALLAWDPVAADAMFALRKIAEELIGQLIDALIDPNQPFAVRRRLTRVFSVCVSQR